MTDTPKRVSDGIPRWHAGPGYAEFVRGADYDELRNELDAERAANAKLREEVADDAILARGLAHTETNRLTTDDVIGARNLTTDELRGVPSGDVEALAEAMHEERLQREGCRNGYAAEVWAESKAVRERWIATARVASQQRVDYEAAYAMHENVVEQMSGKRPKLNDEGKAMVREIVDAALGLAKDGGK